MVAAPPAATSAAAATDGCERIKACIAISLPLPRQLRPAGSLRGSADAAAADRIAASAGAVDCALMPATARSSRRYSGAPSTGIRLGMVSHPGLASLPFLAL